MKSTSKHFLFFVFTMLLGWASISAIKHTSAMTPANTEIVGEWKLYWEAKDENKNDKLDENERKSGRSNTNYYYRFNADGTCEIYLKGLKGHYDIKNEGNKKKISIYSDEEGTKGLVAVWVLISVNEDELVLLEGTGEIQIWAFKRVK